MAYTTINKSTDYFNTTLITGNNSTQAFTGLGFAPAMIWTKKRNGSANHLLYDKVRGVGKYLYPNLQNAEGGNGKSLVMRSVRHWKKSYEIAGRGIDPSSSRFLFSGVQLDTGFVWIDDAEKDFDFQRLYNYTTGDMEIERKNKDRISLSLETKPKLGITTNYILPDTDGSTRRRQYVVEFGSYWHDLKEKDKEPKDVYGKQFFGYSFSDDDWLDFYNFGFRCVEEFLRKGVILNNRSNYRRKQLISQIEGAGINDGVCEWIQDYVVDNETNFKSKDGIPFDNIYGDFTKHFEEDIIENWSSNRFKKSLFDICQEKKWNYNPHKSHRGSRLSDRRFLTGPKGQQIESVRIELPITEKVT